MIGIPKCAMTLKGHPKSLILTSFKKPICIFLLAIHSNLGPGSQHNTSVTDDRWMVRQTDGWQLCQ